MATRRLPGRAAAMLTLVLAASGLAACGQDDPVTPAPTSTVSPITDVDPSVAALQGEALRVYRGYLAAVAAANKSGDYQSPDLRNFVGEPLLTEVSFNMRKNFDHGAYYEGEIKPVDARVTEMSLSTTPATMTVSSCLDYSTFRLVNRADKVPVPKTTPFGRVPSTGTVTKFSNGQWLLSATSTAWERTC